MEVAPINPRSMETPAVFINHFQMMVIGGVLVRLSFGEMAPGGPVYRSTILMGAEDARQIAQAILTSLGTTGGRPS
jgi:hypothetical protein